MKQLNLNKVIKVKLTEYGKEIYFHQYDELNRRLTAEGMKPLGATYPDVDEDGYSKFQLWSFMRLYGEYMKMAGPEVIKPLDICIDEKDLENVYEKAV